MGLSIVTSLVFWPFFKFVFQTFTGGSKGHLGYLDPLCLYLFGQQSEDCKTPRKPMQALSTNPKEMH